MKVGYYPMFLVALTCPDGFRNAAAPSMITPFYLSRIGS